MSSLREQFLEAISRHSSETAPGDDDHILSLNIAAFAKGVPEKAAAVVHSARSKDYSNHPFSSAKDQMVHDALVVSDVSVDAVNFQALKKLPGYLELHRICADPAIDVKICFSEELMPYTRQRYYKIAVNLMLPYSETKDAGVHLKVPLPAPSAQP